MHLTSHQKLDGDVNNSFTRVSRSGSKADMSAKQPSSLNLSHGVVPSKQCWQIIWIKWTIYSFPYLNLKCNIVSLSLLSIQMQHSIPFFTCTPNAKIIFP